MKEEIIKLGRLRKFEVKMYIQSKNMLYTLPYFTVLSKIIYALKVVTFNNCHTFSLRRQGTPKSISAEDV